MKKKIIIGILGILVLIGAGGILMSGWIKKNKWEKQELVEYSKHRGGGMNGGSDRTTLSAYGDKALLTYSETDWYYEDPTVTEYLVSREVLDEIREIFMKYSMYDWHRKKFSDHFVADGETTAYDFWFSEDDVSFSSQIYPARYADGLAELDRVIGKYSVDGEKLPGLVLPELLEKAAGEPQDGTVTCKVYEYSQNRLKYRIGNGTDTDIFTEGKYRLTDEAGNTIAASDREQSYARTVSSGSSAEDSVELESRLKAGKYKLYVDGLSCGFEIR